MLAIIRFLLILGIVATAAPARAGDGSRYLAVLADGTRVEGDELRGWHEPEGQPTLDGVPLLAGDRPMRWLVDRQRSPAREPAAFVETVTGDRIPGRVAAYQPANTSTDETLDAYFEVHPAMDLRPPQRASDSIIRVLARYVRRIVWEHRESESPAAPGTVRLADGAVLRYRSARFSAAGVRLLMDDGQRSLSFAELASIDVPPTQPAWMSLFDELAVLAPTAGERIIQIESTGGLVATTSLARYHVYSRGNAREPARWVHGVQPAWSPRVLWVPNDQIWMRRLFRPDEIPLSRLLPVAADHRALLTGSPRPWRVNRNVSGEPLRSGGREFGWGFGLHAPGRFEFALPPGATELEGRLGLDHAAGSGGSIRGRVVAGEQVLFETSDLVGSNAEPVEMRVALPPPGHGAPSLALVVDPLTTGHPAGADPLDIRDFADWLEPRLRLDPRTLDEHLAARRHETIEAWRGWTVSIASPGRIHWRHLWDELSGAEARFETSVVALDEPLILERTVPDGAAQWLIVSVSRLENVTVPPVVEVRVDGERIASYPVPARTAGRRDVAPLVVPLSDYQGKLDAMRLEIRQQPGAWQVPVRWHAIRLANALPTVACLLEDDGDFRSAASAASAPFRDDDRHSGTRCLELAALADVQRGFAAPFEVRERPAWGQYRFIRFAFRKSGEGRMALELVTPGGGPVVRYDAGGGEPTLGAARRVWSQRLPDEWIVITRDLFADFGAVDIEGLRLIVPDGRRALVDHVYLARSTDDFVHLPPALAPELANQKARRALADEALRRALPATVRITCPDGRLGTGVIVDPRGIVLTAGHLLASRPTGPLTIELDDGRRVEARPLGINRDLDLGLAGIEGGDPWPAASVRAEGELPVPELFVAVAHQAGESRRPAAHLAGLRRQLDTQLWTDFDLDHAAAGGPLVDRHGNVVGIHTHRSQFGGFYYSRPADWTSLAARLESGEIWGRWLAGTGPVFGVDLDSSRGRCDVVAVAPGSPADQAGIQVADVVLQIGDAEVSHLEHVYEQLADRSPGDAITVVYQRSETRHTAELRLRARE